MPNKTTTPLIPGIPSWSKLSPKDLQLCNEMKPGTEIRETDAETGTQHHMERKSGIYIHTQVDAQGAATVEVWELPCNHKGAEPQVEAGTTYSKTTYNRPFDRKTEEVINGFLKDQLPKPPAPIPNCKDILAEPDRPGQWWWLEPRGEDWKMVVVKRIAGGHLSCDELKMADLEGQKWSGAWWLKSQDSPAYGRAKKIYAENSN